MTPGQIVAVDWRDAMPGSGEPNKRRPAIVVGSARVFCDGLPFAMVVPLTGAPELAIDGAAIAIEPTDANGCTKTSYALAWCVQTVSLARVQATPSRITGEQLSRIRARIAACVEAI